MSSLLMVRPSKRVFIHKNEAGAEGKVLIISEDISFETLKRLACEKLGMRKPRKVYLASGSEVSEISDINSNDNLYFSAGEPFYRATGSGTEKMFICILGSGGVGKSALTLRYVRDFFVQKWEPTIEDAYRKTARVDDKVAILEILDTAGQEDYSTMRAQWMADKNGYVLVYGLDDKDSLQQLYPYIETLEQVHSGRGSVPPLIVVGNKKDLLDQNPDRRAVSAQDAATFVQHCRQALARIEQNGSHADRQTLYRSSLGETLPTVWHFETSALTGEHVDAVFEQLVREIRVHRRPAPKQPSWCFLF